MNKRIIFSINIIVLCLIGLFLLSLNQNTSEEEYHIHTDFKVYLIDEFLDFNKSEYMSDDEKVLSPLIHLHDMNPDVIHYHHETAHPLDLFESFGMQLTDSCISLQNKSVYCSNEEFQLTILVNGVEISSLDNYIPQDLDRILISYSNKTQKEIVELFDIVTDVACIQSLVCPERGEPSDESSCTGSSCLYVFE